MPRFILGPDRPGINSGFRRKIDAQEADVVFRSGFVQFQRFIEKRNNDACFLGSLPDGERHGLALHKSAGRSFHGNARKRRQNMGVLRYGRSRKNGSYQEKTQRRRQTSGGKSASLRRLFRAEEPPESSPHPQIPGVFPAILVAHEHPPNCANDPARKISFPSRDFSTLKRDGKEHGGAPRNKCQAGGRLGPISRLIPATYHFGRRIA